MRSALLCAVVVWLALAGRLLAITPEVEDWGMLRGVRLDGQLFPIKTAVRLASPGWTKIVDIEPGQIKEGKASITSGTREYRGKIELNGATLIYAEQITVRDGAIVVHIEATAPSAIPSEGLIFVVSIPTKAVSGGTAKLLGAAGNADAKTAVIPADAQETNIFLGGEAVEAELSLGRTRVQLKADAPKSFTVQDDRKWNSDQYSVLVPIHNGNLVAGQKVSANVELRVDTGSANPALPANPSNSVATPAGPQAAPTNLLINPMDPSSWRFAVREGAVGTLRSESGALRIDIDTPGREASYIQMYQIAQTFVAGRPYILSITLRSSTPRKLGVTAQLDAPPNDLLLPSTDLNVGPEWKQYKLRFTVTKAVSGPARMPVFNVGSTAGAIDISALSLTEAPASPASGK